MSHNGVLQVLIDNADIRHTRLMYDVRRSDDPATKPVIPFESLVAFWEFEGVISGPQPDDWFAGLYVIFDGLPFFIRQIQKSHKEDGRIRICQGFNPRSTFSVFFPDPLLP